MGKARTDDEYAKWARRRRREGEIFSDMVDTGLFPPGADLFEWMREMGNYDAVDAMYTDAGTIGG